MKRMMSVFLALALVLCMGMTVFAADITTLEGSAAEDVKATYQAGGSSATIYSVDVTWGSMEYTYTAAGEGTWLPSTHAYEGATEAAWSCATDANKITVTNHSNTALAAALSYTAEASYSAISGSFGNSTLNLATAVGTTIEEAPTANTALTLSGALSSSVTTSTKIGSVTVILS